eukprot:scaffold208352_cov28-Attheya_sp.AAC.1
MNMNASTTNTTMTTVISGGAPNARAKLSRLPLLVAVLATLLLLLLPGAHGHGQEMKKRTLKGKGKSSSSSSSKDDCDGDGDGEGFVNPCKDRSDGNTMFLDEVGLTACVSCVWAPFAPSFGALPICPIAFGMRRGDSF